MAEEKDAAELEAEKDEEEGPPLPPIPPQILPSSGVMRKTQPEPGAWLREHKVTPPRGSFMGDSDYGDPDAPPVKAPAMHGNSAEPRTQRDRVEVKDSSRSASNGSSGSNANGLDDDGESVRVLRSAGASSNDSKKSTARQTTAREATGRKATDRKTAGRKTTVRKVVTKKATANKSTAKKTTAKKGTSRASSTGRRRSS
jgi:hypothetical protein